MSKCACGSQRNLSIIPQMSSNTFVQQSFSLLGKSASQLGCLACSSRQLHFSVAPEIGFHSLTWLTFIEWLI